MKVKFYDYNQMDIMYLDVDAISQEVIFATKKRDSEGEYFVSIYADGFASYGYTRDCDPLHRNKPYTWSSRPEVINEVFDLNGTDLQLAKYSIGVREEGLSYWSRGILLSKAIKIASDNAELLHYGIEAFKENNIN